MLLIKYMLLASEIGLLAGAATAGGGLGSRGGEVLKGSPQKEQSRGSRESYQPPGSHIRLLCMLCQSPKMDRRESP
jgi:hypothetical protein